MFSKIMEIRSFENVSEKRFSKWTFCLKQLKKYIPDLLSAVLANGMLEVLSKVRTAYTRQHRSQRIVFWKFWGRGWTVFNAPYLAYLLPRSFFFSFFIVGAFSISSFFRIKTSIFSNPTCSFRSFRETFSPQAII